VKEAFMVRKIIRPKVEPPQKTRKEEYHEYLKTDTWFEKKQRVLKRDSYRCRLCNSPNRLNVHHRCYPEVFGEEQDDDLLTLCKNCHEKFHEVQHLSKTPEKKKRNKMSKTQRRKLKNKKKLMALILQQRKDSITYAPMRTP
jgi:hypothetical protein